MNASRMWRFSGSRTTSISRRMAPWSRQHLKPHLAEMTVGCESVSQSDLAHDHEARAIGEREVFVAIVEEQLTGLLKPVAVDALPSESRASIDLLPPRLSGAQPEAEPKER